MEMHNNEHKDDQHEGKRNDIFERELSAAMRRRVNAPETIERFLMAAAEAEQNRRNTGSARHGRILAFPSLPRQRAWFGGAIAAVLAIGVFGLEGVRVHREHERQALADQQFEQAQQITDRALDHVREQLARAGVSLDDK